VRWKVLDPAGSMVMRCRARQCSTKGVRRRRACTMPRVARLAVGPTEIGRTQRCRPLLRGCEAASALCWSPTAACRRCRLQHTPGVRQLGWGPRLHIGSWPTSGVDLGHPLDPRASQCRAALPTFQPVFLVAVGRAPHPRRPGLSRHSLCQSLQLRAVQEARP
jgi:hypothetical protein